MKLNWAERWVVNNPSRVFQQKAELYLLKKMMDLKFAGQVLPAEAVHGSFMAALSSGYAKVIGLNEFKSEMSPSENR